MSLKEVFKQAAISGGVAAVVAIPVPFIGPVGGFVTGFVGSVAYSAYKEIKPK